jgi:hypothetical protein
MAGYDPKRPRPTAASEDPPPVEALLEPPTSEVPAVVPSATEGQPEGPGPSGSGDTPPRPSEPDAPSEPAVEVDLREPSTNGSTGRAHHEVPVAPAPEEGTANRAVLVAALSGVLALVAVLVVWRRHRRNG